MLLSLTDAVNVLQVRTLEGAEVWRRRHYRVKRGKVSCKRLLLIVHWRL